jgi:hypothetical protein
MDALQKKLIAACEGAVRCLKSIERNERMLFKLVSQASPASGIAFASDLVAWKRNLSHARRVLEELEKAPTP